MLARSRGVVQTTASSGAFSPTSSTRSILRGGRRLRLGLRRDLGSEEELAGIGEILSRGNGADRQLHVFNANRDIVEVVREIANVTEVAAESAAA